jgi:hypothetical protein
MTDVVMESRAIQESLHGIVFVTTVQINVSTLNWYPITRLTVVTAN